MKILAVLAHQHPGSFCHAIAEAAIEELKTAGHTVVYHDLYAERFDAVLPHEEIPKGSPLDPIVARHCDELAAADGYLIVHPNWWAMPPAILKGWIDRVVLPGVAYRFVEGDSGEGIPEGLLKAKTAVVLNTSNTEPAREQAAFGDPLETLWVRCVFALCGVEDVRRRTFGVLVTSTEGERAAWLEEAAEIAQGAFPR